MDKLLEEFSKKYDDYEIISSIGKDTWQIRLTSYDRLAVLKRIDNPDIYKKLGNLKINGIPTVYNVFERDGENYAIEEFINGTILDTILASRGKLSAQEVRGIVIKLCKILTPLHNADIVHRDIKPSNLILTSDNSLYLIDFGIARIKTDMATEDTKHLGTEFYASPEQYGFAQSDNRSDIYSIGKLMLVLLTGKENADNVHKLPYSGIISKCTQVDSKKRYPNVKRLQQAFGAKRAVGIILLSLILLTVVICLAGHRVSRYVEKTTKETTDTTSNKTNTTEILTEITTEIATFLTTVTETQALTDTTETTTTEVTSLNEKTNEQTSALTQFNTTSNVTETTKTDTKEQSNSIVHEYASEAVTDTNGYITNSLEFDNIAYYKNVCFDNVSAEENPYILIEPGWTKQVGEIQLFEGKLTPVYAEQTKSGINLTLNGKTLFLPNTENVTHYPYSNLEPTGRIYTLVFCDFDSDGVREILPVELAYYNEGGTKITKLYSTARFIRVNADMSMTLCGGEAVIADNTDDYIYIENDGVVVYNMDIYKNIAYKLNGNTVVKK